MLETYFYIQVQLDNKRFIEFGPYLSFDEAALIFMDHCNFLVDCYFDDIPERYRAFIVECMVQNSKRETIHIKVEEEKIFRRFDD